VADERDRIQNDGTLTQDEKAERLAALDKQAQTVSDQILGVPPPPEPPPLPPVPEPNPVAAIHNFSPGETVDMIAARYGVSALSIMNANPNLNFNQLQSGTQIKIPKLQ